MEEEVIQIIEEISGYKNLNENLDIDLLENEILDSLAFIELVTNLEEKFNIEIQVTQVNPNTWRSVKSIVNLVKTLK